MNILLIGSGGREHAIANSLVKSKSLKRLVVAPGNPGIEKIAECIDIKSDDIDNLCTLAQNIKADYVVVGPEKPLVLGISDKLSELGIKTFGPSANASKLEGSKSYARDFCSRNRIPQPNYKYFSNLDEANEEIHRLKGYCVVKADGLASGKGVVVCSTTDEAITASMEILQKKKFGASGNRILIEERIIGVEASIFLVCDGNEFKFLGTAQDYKRAYDGDQGPNTGGMGAISPSQRIDNTLLKEIKELIVKPTIDGMKQEKNDYIGILYIGIMITNEGPKVIEFNCRLGDPEAQAILPLLKTDFLEIIFKTINKNIVDLNIEMHAKKALNVVLSSKGYPENFKTNLKLPNIKENEIDSNLIIFHSGTEFDSKKNIVSSGGRVFSITILDNNIKKCRQKIYRFLNNYNLKNFYFRRDIGK